MECLGECKLLQQGTIVACIGEGSIDDIGNVILIVSTWQTPTLAGTSARLRTSYGREYPVQVMCYDETEVIMVQDERGPSRAQQAKRSPSPTILTQLRSAVKMSLSRFA